MLSDPPVDPCATLMVNPAVKRLTAVQLLQKYVIKGSEVREAIGTTS